MVTKVLHIVLLGVAAAMAGGCNLQPNVTEERLDRGLVLVYTGIEGRSPFNQAICDALVEAKVPYAVELVDWTVGVPGAYLVNLRAEARNRAKAAEIALRITRYRMQFPGRPVILVGQSGGAAVAVWTAEQMEFGQKVDGIILLAAALSPDYMLHQALANSRRGLVNFCSSADRLFLGMGTSVAGTMDGYHGSSAGRVGFRVPMVKGRPPEYEKFFQVTWQEEMSRAGHWGGHTSTSSGAFVREYVAPLVTAPRWSKALIDCIAGVDARPVDSFPADRVDRSAGVYDRF